MSTSEFNPDVEHVIAVIHQQDLDGLTAQAPIVIGHYGPHNEGEVWLECDGGRFNLRKSHATEFMRQLRRALKAAADIEEA
jgi:hypothetical protein